MPSMFTLRNMWRDALTRKGLTVNDLDADTQALITDYESKETIYNTKVSTYETASNTAQTLQRELMRERGDIMSSDSKINHAIMSIRDTPTSPTPPVLP